MFWIASLTHGPRFQNAAPRMAQNISTRGCVLPSHSNSEISGEFRPAQPSPPHHLVSERCNFGLGPILSLGTSPDLRPPRVPPPGKYPILEHGDRRQLSSWWGWGSGSIEHLKSPMCYAPSPGSPGLTLAIFQFNHKCSTDGLKSYRQ